MHLLQLSPPSISHQPTSQYLQVLLLLENLSTISDCRKGIENRCENM